MRLKSLSRKFKLGCATIALSLVWTIFSWSSVNHLYGLLHESAPFFLAFAVSEGLFGLGILLGLAGGAKSWHRGQGLKQFFASAEKNLLVRWGFFVNWTAATASGVIGAIGVVVVLPFTAWTLLYLPILDLVATFARCWPIYRRLRLAKSSLDTVTIRPVRPGDIPTYLEIQAVEWPEKLNASEAMVRNRVAVNPGGIMVAEHNGCLVGMVTTIKIPHYDYSRSPTWDEITAEGWCHNHLPDGSIIYGVDLTVSRYAPFGTYEKLLLAVGVMAVRDGIKYCMLGGRMPKFHKQAEVMSPAEYMLAQRSNGHLLDPEIELYSRIPGLQIVQLLPDYIEDPASCNYGVLLRWRNPLYRLPAKRLLARLFPLLYEIEKSLWSRRRTVTV